MGKDMCSASSTTPRVERKIVEKNRRNKMKNLHCNLMSLLPNHVSKEGSALPDQIDQAVEYIKFLNMKLEKIRQKKQSLLPQPITKRSHCSTSCDSTPHVQVHENMGPNVDVILANGLINYSHFSSIISDLAHQRGVVEIASASFCDGGNSTIQVLHDKVKKSNLVSTSMSGAKNKELTICENLKTEELESHLNIWDYEIEDKMCFQI